MCWVVLMIEQMFKRLIQDNYCFIKLIVDEYSAVQTGLGQIKVRLRLKLRDFHLERVQVKGGLNFCVKAIYFMKKFVYSLNPTHLTK